MKRAGGRSVQGYDAQVVASPEQVIIAAQVTQSLNDSDQLTPMVESASETLREAGIEEPIGTVLADGGYWNSPAMSEVRRQVIDVLVPTRTVDAPPDASSHRAKAPKQNGSKPRSQRGKDRRSADGASGSSNPSSAHTKVIRRSDRFLRRGLPACQAEWQLIAATHNLLELWRAAHASAGSAQALAARRRSPADRAGRWTRLIPAASVSQMESPAPRLCATAS
jgi:hypothetical protein